VVDPEDELIDRVVDQVMRGQDPDVEGWIAGAPDLPAATREKLRKVAGAFGGAKPGAAIVSSHNAALPFEELGPYKLVSRMGEGGMGMVYLAEHRFLKRRVALKLIRPELAVSESTRQRFQREAMSIAKLRHENIVSVYDAGEHDGVAFLAMELVDGQGLDELLRSARRDGQRMNVTAAARHARGIALALQCAHDSGIIHRDVKPANVRITPDGRELLLDFGLSLAEDTGSFSSIAGLRGTPQYASPEQLEMDSSAIDGRTDVYSLGVTLYECITGEPPFVGSNMNQLFHQILSRDPPEPRKLNTAVDETLSGIVMRAIEKRRENRFESAGAMARALEGWLGTAERAAPTPRRAPSRLKVLVPAAVVLALGAAAWLAFHDRDRAAASAPRTLVPLLGTPGSAFDRRLDGWDELVGPGAFGADDEGAGVIGSCAEGIAAKPHALAGGSGSVRGSVEPIASTPGMLTQGAGAGIELSDGRIVALLFVPEHDGYEPRVCELKREGASGLVRGADIATPASKSRDARSWTFELSWSESGTRFDWRDATTHADAGSIRLPRAARDEARPRRFLIIVEKGSARFEGLMMEES
jgi:tRNA A-37 threonylcarbamoyl transferase component Bud32